MSFLNELKLKASALQSEKSAVVQNWEANTAETERVCHVVWKYLQELAGQLTVISPVGPVFALDRNNTWPPMKLTGFHADFRKKKLRDKEVFDFIAMGWDIVPQDGQPVPRVIGFNFPIGMDQVQQKLTYGHVEYERKEVRHPEKNTLQEILFEYTTKARGNVTMTADHDNGLLAFRLANVDGFGVVTTTWPAVKIQYALLDELAKLIVAQPNRFL